MATCSLDTIDNKVSRFANGNEVVHRNFPVKEEITEENYSTTVTNMVVTKEDKQSVTITENGNHVDQIVRPIANASSEGFVPGQVVLTVHKAKDIEKKGFVGKADPYVLLTYGIQKEKSTTVNNNQNPVWQITGYFDVEEQSSNEITIEVFDDDFGKDDFLGKTIVDIHELCKSNESINKWIPLTQCNYGSLRTSM